MTAAAATERPELAQRSNDGIEVTVFWTESTNLVRIAVIDSHSADALEFEVDGSAAFDAFNPPFAHAATNRVRSAQAIAWSRLGDLTDHCPQTRHHSSSSGPR